MSFDQDMQDFLRLLFRSMNKFGAELHSIDIARRGQDALWIVCYTHNGRLTTVRAHAPKASDGSFSPEAFSKEYADRVAQSIFLNPVVIERG